MPQNLCASYRYYLYDCLLYFALYSMQNLNTTIPCNHYLTLFLALFNFTQFFFVVYVDNSYRLMTQIKLLLNNRIIFHCRLLCVKKLVVSNIFLSKKMLKKMLCSRNYALPWLDYSEIFKSWNNVYYLAILFWICISKNNCKDNKIFKHFTWLVQVD